MIDDEGTGAGRRTLLKGAAAMSAQVAFAPLAALAQGDPASVRPREEDLLVRVGDAEAAPLTPADIPAAQAPVMAWAVDPQDGTVRSGSRLNRVILLRFDMETLSPPTRARAAEGVLAYTAICTHSGCEVADWLEAEQLLYCACHQTKFNPRDGARVVEGPASRSLPALPLKIVGGRLVVAGGFTGRVGFDEI